MSSYFVPGLESIPKEKTTNSINKNFKTETQNFTNNTQTMSYIGNCTVPIHKNKTLDFTYLLLSKFVPGISKSSAYLSSSSSSSLPPSYEDGKTNSKFKNFNKNMIYASSG